jgi:hypothetical protein
MSPFEALYGRPYRTPLSWSESGERVIVSVFCTVKIQGGQDHEFMFRGGHANYKAHYVLSWFMPLLGGNSLTSSGLILKMNSDYNGVNRELERLA